MTPPPPAKRGFREVIDTTLRGFAVLVICTTIGYLVYALLMMAGDETIVAGDRIVGAVVLALATIVCLLMLALGLDGWLIGGAIRRSGWTGKLHIVLWIAAVAMLGVSLLISVQWAATIAIILLPAAVGFGLLSSLSGSFIPEPDEATPAKKAAGRSGSGTGKRPAGRGKSGRGKTGGKSGRGKTGGGKSGRGKTGGGRSRRGAA